MFQFENVRLALNCGYDTDLGCAQVQLTQRLRGHASLGNFAEQTGERHAGRVHPHGRGSPACGLRLIHSHS